MKTYARKCSITGKGMNEGHVIWKGELYISDYSVFIEWLRDTFKDEIKVDEMTDEDLIDWSFAEGHHYYARWDDDDHLYLDIDGQLIEIKD